MAATGLRQLLKSFCTNSPWKYAVLWKLGHQSPMVVGKVAHTGKHYWVSYDDNFTSKANWTMVDECPEEWLFQFALGIKTIVLIPVLPHGVVQLASLEMVAEDSSITAYIKDRFKCNSIHTELPSSPISSFPENLEESSTTASMNPLNSEDPNTVDTVNHYTFHVPGTYLYEILDIECENRINVNNASFFSFPKGCELHKALLGPPFRRQSNEFLWENEDLFSGLKPGSMLAEGSEPDYLLEAVVGHVYEGSFHMPNRSNTQLPTSSQPQTVESDYYGETQKGPKQSSIKVRRAKPGDNPKARPRDRQLIRDRLKELRELVPNGAKYSIDGLLDQTIKHMVYLRRVTNQVEKLQQWAHREVTSRKNIRSSETKENYQLETSWGFEIGDEPNVYPIVVEDLPYPGHLLIEMLCNEHGLFLEIAQVIRSFNLTILKGVMESYANNKWAHFIVEASRSFHRLDIFWPLMQLLQRQRNPISSKI
ncbi:transcription factor EMB1444 isoform X4 [Gossypium hirsutum]|uniref:Transcription factor EMB1444 isoform X4 n=1 Tax=Gossypium hirsutum TaxID=3635 RepID=A0ABM2ZLX1_GOSHI|nr:transcription factor EMB1444 isoform X4 [Gossypium hirsutum]